MKSSSTLPVRHPSSSLEYSLSHEAKYPTQLREAAEAYRYFVDELHISPSRIIVGGDSRVKASVFLFRVYPPEEWSRESHGETRMHLAGLYDVGKVIETSGCGSTI